MSEEVKICPECGAEYFAHVSECRACEVPLISPGDNISKRPAVSPGGELVCIEEGDYDRVTELARGLNRSGVECKVLNIARGGGSSCSGGGFGIFVQQSIAREAVKTVEDLWQKLHPELRQTEERLDAGLCPACGSGLNGSMNECPDCGLYLGGGGDNCGGCGPSHCS